MSPPLLYLILLFGLLLCFPLGVFPLPVLALKERLNFREQDAGKGLYLVIGNPCAVVIGLLSAQIYHALSFVREQDESLSFGRDQELAELMEQVGKSLPEAALRQRDAPEQIGMTMK